MEGTTQQRVCGRIGFVVEKKEIPSVSVVYQVYHHVHGPSPLNTCIYIYISLSLSLLSLRFRCIEVVPNGGHGPWYAPSCFRDIPMAGSGACATSSSHWMGVSSAGANASPSAAASLTWDASVIWCHVAMVMALRSMLETTPRKPFNWGFWSAKVIPNAHEFTWNVLKSQDATAPAFCFQVLETTPSSNIHMAPSSTSETSAARAPDARAVDSVSDSQTIASATATVGFQPMNAVSLQWLLWCSVM